MVTINARLSITHIKRGSAAMMLLCVLWAGVVAWRSWQDETQQQVQHFRALVEVGSQALEAYFQLYQHALEQLRTRLFDAQEQLIDLERAHTFMIEFKKFYPDVIATSLARAADGHVLLNAEMPLGQPLPSLATAPSFLHAREELQRGQVFSVARPFFGPVVQQWVLPLRLGVRDSQGTLEYMVSAMLPLSKPQSFWQQALLPPGVVLGMLRDDGYLVAYAPLPAAVDLRQVYETPREGMVTAHLRTAGFPRFGIVHGHDESMTEAEVVVFQRLEHYPITFYLKIPQSHIRSQWLQKVRIPFLLLVLLLGSGVAVTSWTVRKHQAWETEREQAARQQHEAGVRFEHIVNSAMDAIISIDETQRIILFNRAAERMFGYPADTILGQPLTQLLPERLQTAHEAYVATFHVTGETLRSMHALGAVPGRRADGTEFPIEASISKVTLGTGIISTAIVRDITERQQAEASLRQATEATAALNQELEALSYAIAHNLRAPLRSIDGFSHALLEEYTTVLDATGQDYLQRVRAAAQRMSAMIDALLQLAHVTRTPLQRESVNLSALAESYIADLQQHEPTRAATIVITPQLVVQGDARLLRVVLENLLGNAWKYTSQQAQAQIAMGVDRQADGALVYWVRDNGIGFDMAYADKLFGAFQRLHTAAAFPGTGVGLATVQRIVQHHGGRIWAEGVVGQGATFFFTLL